MPTAAQTLRPSAIPYVSLAPLLNNTGFAVSGSTLERVVSSLDRAKAEQRRMPHERWRYSFTWGDNELIVVGFPNRAIIYGTNLAAMYRLAEVITLQCTHVLVDHWPEADKALTMMTDLLDRYGIDRENPWAFRPAGAVHAAYCADLAEVLAECAQLSGDSFNLLYHTCIRRGLPQVGAWLDHLLVAYDAGQNAARGVRAPERAYAVSA